MHKDHVNLQPYGNLSEKTHGERRRKSNTDGSIKISGSSFTCLHGGYSG